MKIKIEWCNAYGCWCDDVEEITDWQFSCKLNCEDCEDLCIRQEQIK